VWLDRPRPGDRHPAAVLDATPRRPGSIGVYLPGNWPCPFGIVLVLDRLSALMLLLTG
jgi:formate hydrogenlyase subunit 3/multisubunit Na+/H+ antiporter MnhD subunit